MKCFMVVVGNPCFNIVVVVILLVEIHDVIKLSRILKNTFPRRCCTCYRYLKTINTCGSHKEVMAASRQYIYSEYLHLS